MRSPMRGKAHELLIFKQPAIDLMVVVDDDRLHLVK